MEFSSNRVLEFAKIIEEGEEKKEIKKDKVCSKCGKVHNMPTELCKECKDKMTDVKLPEDNPNRPEVVDEEVSKKKKDEGGIPVDELLKKYTKASVEELT